MSNVVVRDWYWDDCQKCGKVVDLYKFSHCSCGYFFPPFADGTFPTKKPVTLVEIIGTVRDDLDMLEGEFGLGDGDDYYYWLLEQSEKD